MHRQAPVAVRALAACAVIASGAVMLRERILTFSSWPQAHEQRAPDVAIPPARPFVPRGSPGRVAPRSAAAHAGGPDPAAQVGLAAVGDLTAPPETAVLPGP